MAPPIRALVIADAVASRRLISEALAGEPGIEVIGSAANEKIALAKLKTLRVDAVTVAPEMAGALEIVRTIRHAYPRLPLIMFSALSLPGLGVTRALMANGATDCVTAPAGADGAALSRSIREALIPRMKTLCARPPQRSARVEIVAIGISTGGPNALPVLLSALPDDFPVPVVIVQHMPPVFTRQLAERLNTKCVIQVREAEAGVPLCPGQVWLAPGDFHLIVVPEAAGARMELHREQQENSCRPSVDPLFRSIAEVYGEHALGVVMTGMGRDGLKGCEAIREAGGQIIVQDEASSVVWGMPGSVVRAGLADAVFPLAELGAEVLRRVQAGRHVSGNGASHAR